MTMTDEAPLILVVDDDSATRRTLSLILEHSNYRVTTAATGDEALTLAAQEPFDLALIDLRLPDVEGVDLLKPLRALHPDITMVMATGYASVETAVHAVNNGVDGYVTKPLDIDAVLEKVRDLLERQRLRRENQRLLVLAQQELNERRQAEEALQEALQQANDARRALLSVIEDQKHAEEALTTERALLRTMVDQLPVAVYVKDIEGRMTLANTYNLRSTYGVASEAEVLGKTALDLFPEDLGRKYYDDDMRVIHSGEPVIDEEEAKPLPNGRIGWQVTSKVPMRDAAGQIIGLVGFSQDVTEYKEAQQRVNRQERLAAIGQLAAGIAHDFRNLLTTVILVSQLAQRKLDAPDQVSSYLENITTEARKATDLVQQILDFGRRTEIETRLLDLATLLGSVAAVLVRTLPENILVRTKIDAGQSVIHGDSGRIQQALMNLALNARDAMPSGGTLTLGLTRITMAPGARPPLPEMATVEQPPAAWLCLSVADTGTGMTDETYAHLFEPFYTTKGAGQGTGLGLAQVYGIVQLHNGFVDVENVYGKGVTLRIYLPAAEEEVVETEEASRSARHMGKGETILLVEDNGPLREATRAMLEGLNYRVLSATNGQEALTRYGDDSSIALVITDLVMPVMGARL